MIGTLQYRPRANSLKHNEYRIHDANAELIRAIQEVGGKSCFATDLSYVCPEIYCRWREDCFNLGDG